MRFAHPLALVAFATLAGSLSVSAGQSASAGVDQLLGQLLGTWQLNLAQSKYLPGPAPIEETRTYARGSNGVQGTIRRRFADGRSERIEYIAEFDREYPVIGTEQYDHVLFKRIDTRTAEAVLSHAGAIFGTARRTISTDGRTMTVTFQRHGVGATVLNVSLFEKVAQ
jgi:hypothetical protein